MSNFILIGIDTELKFFMYYYRYVSYLTVNIVFRLHCVSNGVIIVLLTLTLINVFGPFQ